MSIIDNPNVWPQDRLDDINNLSDEALRALKEAGQINDEEIAELVSRGYLDLDRANLVRDEGSPQLGPTPGGSDSAGDMRNQRADRQRRASMPDPAGEGSDGAELEAVPDEGGVIADSGQPMNLLEQKRLLISEIARRRDGGEDTATTVDPATGETLYSNELAALSNQTILAAVNVLNAGSAVTTDEMKRWETEFQTQKEAALAGGGPIRVTGPDGELVDLAEGAEGEASEDKFAALERDALTEAGEAAAAWTLEFEELDESKLLSEGDLLDKTVYKTLGPGGTITTENGTILYNERSAHELVGQMNSDQLMELREDLYFAGYLSSLPEDEVAGWRGEEDINALLGAMNDVNLQGGGMRVEDFVAGISEDVLVNRGGVPIGQDLAQQELQGKALQEWAKAQGVDLSDSYIDQSIFDMANGGATFEMEKQKIRSNMLSGWYPKYAEALEQGQDMTQIASRYIEQMATVLEIDPNSISLDDPYVSAALQSPDDVSLATFDKTLRQDPRWATTANAYQEVGNSVNSLMSKMGL